MSRTFEILVRVHIKVASQNSANEHACELAETIATKLREQDVGGQIETFRCYPQTDPRAAFNDNWTGY